MISKRPGSGLLQTKEIRKEVKPAKKGEGAVSEVGRESREVSWKPHENCFREGVVTHMKCCWQARTMKAESQPPALIPRMSLGLWEDQEEGEVVAKA